jgi:ketosteroid isomerase-like protein
MNQRFARHARLIAASFALAFYAGAVAAGTEDEINQIEERRYEAMAAGNTQALAQILADEFAYHQPSGAVATKASYIEQIKSGRVKIKSFERYGVTVHVYGDTATAMGSTRLDVELEGQPRKVDLAYLNVWVQRDGRWQLAARQSAFKPAPK